MMVGGPSVQYLRELGDNPKNSLVFSCYQGEGSLSRQLLQMARAEGRADNAYFTGEGITQAMREPLLKVFPAALLGRLVVIRRAG